MIIERVDFEHPWGTELEMPYNELKEKLQRKCVKILEPCIELNILHIPEDRFDRTMVIVVSNTFSFGIWTFIDNPDSARGFVGVIPAISQLLSSSVREGAVG